jgi:hypothetical protein
MSVWENWFAGCKLQQGLHNTQSPVDQIYPENARNKI